MGQVFKAVALLSWCAATIAVETSHAKTGLKLAFSSGGYMWSANTTILFPDDDEFANSTARWTVFKPPTFNAVVRPGTEADAAKAVQLATEHNISFLATGGRHGYTTTLGRLQHGVEIDLSQFSSISIDKSDGTLTIGGGVVFSDIFNPVYDAGYTIGIGSCSCPGMTGVTIGAGVGRQSGLLGLLQDSLISVRMITAQGKVITVSANSNSDLFWAIRGAGANFGVITSATYQLHRPTNNNQLTNVDFVFTADQADAYFDVLASFNGTLPAELASISIILYNATISAPEVLANWVYFGPEDEARQAMAKIFELSPALASVSVVPWSQLTTIQAFGIDAVLCQKNVIRDVYSTNVRNLSAATFKSTFQKMMTFYADYPTAQSSALLFEVFPNQGTLKFPADSTAYPWRDSLGNLLLNFFWTEPNSTVTAGVTKLGQELRQDFFETSGYPEISVYVNYANGDETVEQIYSQANLPRLAALKSKWDPQNVFRFSNPLPIKYP